jgi:hypothetical protein
VTTFHRLCERLGTEAGVLPTRPDPIPQGWWDETLPGALEAAVAARPNQRYHAVVVDEGQDFEARWFELLQRLLVEPTDVFWVQRGLAASSLRERGSVQFGAARRRPLEGARARGRP